MNIGPYHLDGQVILAPMAGITDLPFRNLCRKLGAAMAVSEMVSSKKELRHTAKTSSRLCHDNETGPISVQIAGTDPQTMAEAAQYHVKHGAQIIDINMGCPAKKICNVEAGSALMKNEPLVKDILDQVVSAVNVPVTLKTRTGWSSDQKNIMKIAEIAESSGIKALTIHGRTRQCGYSGEAEYELIRKVKQQSAIAIIANGDIDSVEKAQFVLQYTGADAIMIARAAQYKPWIFREINHYLRSNDYLPEPSLLEVKNILLELLSGIYKLYGENHGARVARKHIKAFVSGLYQGKDFWKLISHEINSQQQYKQTNNFFIQLIEHAKYQSKTTS